MQFRWIPDNNEVILCYRLNRALEEAEKYKTALQNAKSQSKVSLVYIGIFVCICVLASPPTRLVSASQLVSQSVCLSV